MSQLTNVQKLEVDKEIAKFKNEIEKNSMSYDKLSKLTSYQTEMISIMHKTVAKGTTVPELAYFLSVAKSSGLNPLNKEIWCYKDNKDNLIVFAGRDGFLKKNKENPLYRGMRSSEVCEYDEFEIDMISGDVKHIITNNRGNVIGAYAIVFVEGQKDTIIYLDIQEFDLGQAKWKTSKKMMIKKCAQSHALKEAAGITGIQNEESFNIKNGVAYADVVSAEPVVNKESERLSLMIERCNDIESLEKLKKECITPDDIALWDSKKKDLSI